eukprot:CAMPEP_0114166166 /NCGR_PEP_ID=MMETSP0043_2-20121206/31681_1 /TAXON_ID=464988 /ORGANISM="Hemiselmis andersenii, Strain CCMP644" /LENGTH=106 /DNA_ID=CAMNT_0001263125 /DNA_START=201 /DNA_END=518 /DNA_ORIENTATION=+
MNAENKPILGALRAVYGCAHVRTEGAHPAIQHPCLDGYGIENVLPKHVATVRHRRVPTLVTKPVALPFRREMLAVRQRVRVQRHDPIVPLAVRQVHLKSPHPHPRL